MSDLSGAIVLGQYGVISLYGLYSWIKMYKKQKEQENVHATSIERA